MIGLFEINDFMEEELERCKHPFSALPVYAHNKNIRAVVPPSLWTKIRKEVLEEHDFTCHVCGLKKKEGPIGMPMKNGVLMKRIVCSF